MRYLTDIRCTARVSQVLQREMEKIRLQGWSWLMAYPSTFTNSEGILGAYPGTVTQVAFDSYNGTTTVTKGTLTGGSEVSLSGNVNIYGRARTGLCGTVSRTGNDKIGATLDESKCSSTVVAAISNGWIRNNFAIDMPNATVPTELTTTSNLATIAFGPGDYRADSFNFSGNVVHKIDGNVRLNVNGPVTVSGNAKMEILNNSSLTLYAGGRVNLSGNGCYNDPSIPTNLVICGLPGYRGITLSSNSDWNSCVYAPQAALTMSGNGKTYGSLVAATSPSAATPTSTTTKP